MCLNGMKIADNMSEVRKDSKERKLWQGEIQRTDGKYVYRYVDKNGNRQEVYS